MVKDVDDPSTPGVDSLANLWLCEGDRCDEAKGEGSIVIDERVLNVRGDPDGVGAYEFQVKFDHKIFDITVCEGDQPADPVTGLCPDIVVGSSHHWLYEHGRVPNWPTGLGGCDMTIVNENAILFGCVSKDNPETVGNDQGATSNGTIATLRVTPDSDIMNRLTPGQNNGVVRTILDENCELADIYGDPLSDGTPADICGDPPDPNCPYVRPLPGVNPGGDLASCGDVTLTVRILEGDLNLDCQVNVVDDQAIAYRYGASFGNLLYDPWYDLEPPLKDFDIDIKDLQKVFGRNGSVCSVSGTVADGTIPEQEPLPPPPAP
jgi:hypothetical protein